MPLYWPHLHLHLLLLRLPPAALPLAWHFTVLGVGEVLLLPTPRSAVHHHRHYWYGFLQLFALFGSLCATSCILLDPALFSFPCCLTCTFIFCQNALYLILFCHAHFFFDIKFFPCFVFGFVFILCSWPLFFGYIKLIGIKSRLDGGKPVCMNSQISASM